MYVISGRYTSFLSVQYILYSQTLVYFFWYGAVHQHYKDFCLYIMSYTEVHSRLFVLFIFFNFSWIKDTFLGLGGDQARCIP